MPVSRSPLPRPLIRPASGFTFFVHGEAPLTSPCGKLRNARGGGSPAFGSPVRIFTIAPGSLRLPRKFACSGAPVNPYSPCAPAVRPLLSVFSAPPNDNPLYRYVGGRYGGRYGGRPGRRQSASPMATAIDHRIEPSWMGASFRSELGGVMWTSSTPSRSASADTEKTWWSCLRTPASQVSTWRTGRVQRSPRINARTPERKRGW